MNTFNKARRGVNYRPTVSHRKTKLPTDEEMFRHWEDDLTYRQVGDIYGVHHITVYRRYVRMGLTEKRISRVHMFDGKQILTQHTRTHYARMLRLVDRIEKKEYIPPDQEAEVMGFIKRLHERQEWVVYSPVTGFRTEPRPAHMEGAWMRWDDPAGE